MIPILLDYETLRVLWWLLLGVLLIGFAIMDGFDLGAGALLPFVARTDSERRIVLNTIGPVWEGNQVWLITGGGAIFAAWPPLYAVSFSGFYLAMLCVLLALILRPVGIKFRSKIESAGWRVWWDWAIFISGAVPSLIFGVAVGNALEGVPFSFDADMRATYTGSLIELLNPYALLCGLVSLAMIVTQGGTWLAAKADGPVAERARTYATFAALATIALFAAGGLATAFIDGYRFSSVIVTDGASNPTTKEVALQAGVWLANYSLRPWTILAPVLGFGGSALAAILLRLNRSGLAFAGSSIATFGIVSTAGVSMFPFILPSSTTPNHSLTVWDASSSQGTLWIMLIAALVFVPIILAYTAWVYRVLWGKVTDADVRSNDASY
ncbi:MAG: cytochrome d ubiquinol oxidase subunit II [Alphaproteobacteria bacterium]|nr:cytochrome d ubiquinol oxidase subunit II [Alphaproteobacteria bacterium]